ncbi:hypothetical protein ACOMHN_048629 [Nucella lapillus]
MPQGIAPTLMMTRPEVATNSTGETEPEEQCRDTKEALRDITQVASPPTIVISLASDNKDNVTTDDTIDNSA